MIRRNYLILLSLALLSGACGKPAGSSSSGSTNPSPTPAPSPVPAAFEVVVSTTSEAGGASTIQADCAIPSGSTPYTTPTLVCTNPIGVVTSSVTIPEGQLFFSKLTWTITAGSSLCARAVFRPYFYLANNTSAAFKPPWLAGTSVDCTATPTPATCYGGLVEDIVSTFPTFSGIYFLTAATTTQSYTANSANSHNYQSNRFSVNNLPVASRGAAINFGTVHPGASTDKFIGGAANYTDYFFTCNDQFEQSVFSISLTITDQDLTGVYPNTSQGVVGTNQFPDWDPASWDR